MTHDTREELKKAWIDAWEYHDDKPEHQAEWWLNHFDHQLQKARQDWLRQEIVKLEGMKKQESPMHDAHQFYKVRDYNQALDVVITKYKDELE